MFELVILELSHRLLESLVRHLILVDLLVERCQVHRSQVVCFLFDEVLRCHLFGNAPAHLLIVVELPTTCENSNHICVWVYFRPCSQFRFCSQHFIESNTWIVLIVEQHLHSILEAAMPSEYKNDQEILNRPALLFPSSDSFREQLELVCDFVC